MNLSAGSQLSRMMALVPYLRDRRGIALDQVAADFGTTPRQILTDLNVLWFCGLPNAVTGDLIDIDMDAAEGEGIVTLTNADFLARPMQLSAVEAGALAVALTSLQGVAGDELRPAVDSALAKIESAAAEFARLKVHVSAEEPSVAREPVERALRDGQQLEIDYHVPSRDEVTRRVIDPLRLVVAEGQTYVEAWCHRAGGLRTFRLDRVERVEPTGRPAESHEAPDRQGGGVFNAGAGAPRAELRVAASHRWVPEYVPVDEVTVHDDGSATVLLPYHDPEWLVRLALRFGDAVTVVSPTALAGDIRSRARDALALY